MSSQVPFSEVSLLKFSLSLSSMWTLCPPPCLAVCVWSVCVETRTHVLNTHRTLLTVRLSHDLRSLQTQGQVFALPSSIQTATQASLSLLHRGFFRLISVSFFSSAGGGTDVRMFWRKSDGPWHYFCVSGRVGHQTRWL